jgi:hypothetical protein
MVEKVKQGINLDQISPPLQPRWAALKIVKNIRRSTEMEDVKCPKGHHPSLVIGKIYMKKSIVLKIYFCEECSELFDERGVIADIWGYTENLRMRKPFIYR